MESTNPVLSSRLSTVEKIYGLSLLWREAFYNFAFFDRVPDLNWNKAYQEFLPLVVEAAEPYTYYRLLAKFIGLLQDGHTGILYPQDMLNDYYDYPPVCVRAFDRSAVVVAVDHALVEEIPLGSLVKTVDGLAVEDAVRENVLPYVFGSSPEARWEHAIRGIRMFGASLLSGLPGSTARISIQTPEGEAREVRVARNFVSSGAQWVGRPNFGPVEELLKLTWLAEGTAYLALNSFNQEAIIGQFEAIKPDLLQARAVILDLRRNMGGNTGTGAAILDHFTDRPLTGSRSRTRQAAAAQRAWGQFGGEIQPLTGESWLEFEPNIRAVTDGPKILVPTAVLIGRGTVSAAEDFLVLADTIPHFTTIGEPTAGTTGQPLFFDLPGGGMGFICTKHDTFPDGREFVGPGIQPKIRVETMLEDYRQGRDADLEEARRFLSEMLDATQVT